MILSIIQGPNEILNQKSHEVTIVEKHHKELAINMLETMANEKGLGLSAIQISQPVRLFVMVQADGSPLVLFNPIILSRSPMKLSFPEKCLSYGDLALDKGRSSEVKVKFMDMNGHRQFRVFKGLQSIIVQHEMDHLLGREFGK